MPLYVTPEMSLKLENMLRRRFKGLGIWVESGSWESTVLTVSVRSYKPACMDLFVVSVLNAYGEVDIQGTYRALRGKIKRWNKLLR